jgi:hypothetical protein
MNIGSIIYDYSNNKELGVVVYPLNDRYILFKLENNTHPIFSRLPLNEANTITATGNINETNNQNLKLHLLKYYRQHNLSDSEKKLLDPLMTFAYPNGIPEYKTTTPNSSEELQHMNLIDKLKKGNQFHINTKAQSPFDYLNEKKAHIIDMNDNGIWMGFQDGSKHKLSFLPYENKSAPTFYGISKLIPVKSSGEIKDPIVATLEEELNSRRNNDVLYNVVEHKNNILKLNDKNEIISPQNLNNSYFDFAKNKILLIAPDDKAMTELHELVEKKPDMVISNPSDLSQLVDLEGEVIEPDMTTAELEKQELQQDNIIYGGKTTTEKTTDTNEFLIHNEMRKETPLEQDVLDELKLVDDAFINGIGEDNNNMNNDDNLVEMEGEIEILETVDKIQQKPVPELEKVLDESIQMSNIRKYKIEKIPRGLRQNQRILNKLTNKIQKEVNIISFMKAMTTNDDNTIKYRGEDYKPLVEEYMDYDYQNNFLTPLVVTNKRIYLTPSDKVRNYDSAMVDENILEVYKEINRLSLINKKRLINYKDDVAKMTNNFNPYPQYDMKPVGISVVFGNGKSKKYESYLKSLEGGDSSAINLESVATRLNIQRLSQDTEVVRYGLGKDFEYDNYGGLWVENKSYDTYKAMGPLVYFKEKEKVDLAVLEARIDKNIYNVNPSYDLIYKGDITNMVGFIRMPIMKYINGHRLSKTELDKSEAKNNVIVKYLDSLSNDDTALDEPDKTIIYIFSKDMGQISEEEYNEYLQMVIPSVSDIVEFVNSSSSNTDIKGKISINKAIKLLNKLHYYINSDAILPESKTDKLVNLTYGEYKSLHELLADDIKLYEDLNKELTRRYKNKKDKRVKNKHTIVHKDIIELCNGIYSTKLSEEEFEYMTDKQVIHYYKQEIDSGRYFDLQLQKYKYDHIKGNKIELENTLSVLKNKYDTLTNGIGNSEQVCRKARKPNIVLYESVEHLLEDNGKVITNSSGQLIKQGDYGYVESEVGEKHLYKREALTDGDYWLEQPLSELEKLMDKSTEECKVEEDEKAKMELNPEAECSFDISKLECVPYSPVNKEIEELEEEIKQTIASVDLLDRLPGIQESLANEISKQEQRIRLKLGGMSELNKHETELAIKNKVVEETVNKCVHNKAINKIKAMNNLTDNEKYLYYYEIINQFQDITHTDKLNLEEVEPEEIEDNYIQCGTCNKRLMCKHYLYAANQIKANGEIDYEEFKDIYGEEITGSYYCRICGVWLFNTNVEDDVQFASGEGGGKVIAAREVIEDQSKDLIAKNKEYINNLINETLKGNGSIKEDIEIRLKLYDLFKKLSGIKSLLMDDEITMLNYIKSYNYTPKSTFTQLFKIKFAGKGVSGAVIEKYADIKYKQNYVIELAAIFLVIVQCGNYSVYNKFAGNMIQGYPLLDEEDKSGINYMARLIQSVAELYEFMNDWKRFKDGAYDNIRTKLLSVLKKNILKDEFINNKIEKALTQQYEESSFETERANKSSNYWTTYKPKVGRINWKPEKEIAVVSKDNLGKHTDKQRDILQSQIDYSSMNIVSLIYGYVHNLKPANIHYLRSRIINSSMPINFNKVNAEVGKYQNPEINYYNKIYDNVNGIQANINNINNYTEMKSKLDNINEMDRVKINSITEFKLNRINVGNGSLNLTKEELENVTDKFITTGEFRGMEHIYDKYNICVVSNQKRDSNEPINQVEFPDLLKAIQQKHVLLLQNKSISKTLSEIITVLKEKELADKDILAKLTLNYKENSEYANKLYSLVRQLKTLDVLSENVIMSKKLKPELEKSSEIITESIKKFLQGGNSEGIDSKEKSSDSKKKSVDTSKMLFTLLSNMNTIIQNNVSSLVDKLTNKKEKQVELEDTLIRIGNMPEIINDYKTGLMNQENVINYLNPVNFDKKTDDYTHYIVSDYLTKMFNYVNVLVNMIINNNWVNETNITQYHYKKYFRYSNNKGLFKEWKKLLNGINDIYKSLNILEEGNNCFNYEYIKVVKMYLFIYMLIKMTKVKKTSEVLSEVNDRKAFSFYSYIDTNLSDEVEDEEIALERKGLFGDDSESYHTVNSDNGGNSNGNEVSYSPSNRGDKDPTNNDFIEKIEKQKTTSNKVMVEFVLDIIEDIDQYQKLYNKMNDSNRNKIKEETKQKQTRLNLDTLKALKNNYDTDYNLIIQKMKMGSFSYSELYEKVKEQIGDEFIDNHVESYNDGSGGNYDLGDGEYDPIEAEEIGEVNVMQAEDMEDYEADYGSMVVS